MWVLFVSLPRSWHHLFAMFIWHLWNIRQFLPTAEWAAYFFQNHVPLSTLPLSAQQANGLAEGQSALEPEHGFNDNVETECLIHEKWLWQDMNNWIHNRSNTGNRAQQNSCILSIRRSSCCPAALTLSSWTLNIPKHIPLKASLPHIEAKS